MTDISVEASRKHDPSFVGFHNFRDSTDKHTPYGAFEVFRLGQSRVAGPIDDHHARDLEAGWYWWACHPGCLPDGEPEGPYPTAEGAYLAAIGD